MKTFKILVCFIILSVLGCSKKITDADSSSVGKSEIRQIAQNIAENNTLQSKFIGRIAQPSAQYQNFEALMNQADEKDLIKLTDHNNGVVRAYAFWALAKKKSGSVSSILQKHIQDNEKVKVVFGDILDEVAVADFMLELVCGDDIDPDCPKLSKEQIAQFRTMRNQK